MLEETIIYFTIVSFFPVANPPFILKMAFGNVSNGYIKSRRMDMLWFTAPL